MLIEKTIEYNRLLVLVFVDFQKVIDTVEISSILAALSQCRIDYEYARLIGNMYKNSMAYTRLHKDSDTFPIEWGVKQGDAVSPKLFTAVLEYAFNWDNKGVTIDGVKVSNLRFIDNIIADNLKETEEMTRNMNY